MQGEHSKKATAFWPDPGVTALTAESRAAASYQIKVTLDGVEPSVWRRFVVPGDFTLDRLHDVLQFVMGWNDSHLHDFEIGGRWFTEAPEDPEEADEARFQLCDLLPVTPVELYYEYDFGDGWGHRVTVEQIVPPTHEGSELRCIEGEGACPPEDCGGPYRYADLVRAHADPNDVRHAQAVWALGSQFSPSAFNALTVNEELAKYRRASRRRELDVSDGSGD